MTRNKKNTKLDLEEITNSLHDALFVSDGNGVVLFINKAYTEITGIEADEIIGKSVYELEGVVFHNSATPMVLKEKKPVNTIGYSLKNNREMLVSGSPIFDDDGNIKYVVINDREMGTLTKIESELKATKEMLQKTEINKYKSDLELHHLRKSMLESNTLIGESMHIKKLLSTIEQLSETDVNVLISGETGVGKEVIANELYKKSSRNNQPYIKINCAAIPEALIESELFGHEKGAFTGADKKKIGLLELADSGTVLLDEIGELPLAIQTKFLRAIQQKEFIRVGGHKAIKADIRIIAATNRDLKTMSEEGTFRQDLYYRLNVVPLHLKPLRERVDDIEPLTVYFLNKFNGKYGRDISFTYEAIQLLCAYHWPGNIRELENVIERMVVISTSNQITMDDLKQVIQVSKKIQKHESLDLKTEVETLEKQLIKEAMRAYKTTHQAARALGINQSNVVRKIKKYGLKF